MKTKQIGAAIALAEAVRYLEFRMLQASPGDEWTENVREAEEKVAVAKADYLEAMKGVGF